MRTTVAGVALVLGLTACDPAPGPRAADPASTAVPSVATTPTITPRTRNPHPVSLLALMRARFDGRAFRRGRVLARTAAYTRYAITYRGDGLRLTGIMNVPRGDGPFPVLILNHGHHDLDVYTTGRGLMREQDFLARNGYVVIHPDYRNHAGSDDDPRSERTMRIGYTTDVINAVYAIRRARPSYMDTDRVGMLGRSMGGGITLNVAVVAPDLVDAYVLFAPVSSDVIDNFDRWIREEPLRSNILERYGTPRAEPAFWRNLSSRTFFDRLDKPIQIHHGTSDDSVPISWSRETARLLVRAGKEHRFYVYEGEEHAFGPRFTRSMRRTLTFFDRHVR